MILRERRRKVGNEEYEKFKQGDKAREKGTSAASGTSMRLAFALKTFYYSIIYIPGLMQNILESRD